MKSRCLFVPLVMLCFAGCTSSSKSIGGGYYLRATYYFSWEPPGVSESLCFREPHGVRSRIWKNFTGPILVEDTTAIFVGTTQPGDYELLAVKDGGARLEVGKSILAFEAERETTDVRAYVEQHMIHTWYLKGVANGFELEYLQRHGVNNPYRHLSLTWDQLLAIMRRVEAEGKP